MEIPFLEDLAAIFTEYGLWILGGAVILIIFALGTYYEFINRLF